MRRIIKKIGIFLLTFFLVHLTVIFVDGLNDEVQNEAKVAVILGSKVNEDGTVSERLKARLNRGLKLYQDALVKQIYVSGGIGEEGYPEGTVMAQYLVQNGVPDSVIFIDDLGINTRSSALNFKRDFPNEKQVYVVSQYFHVTRCKLAFYQVGVEAVYGAHANYFSIRDPYSSFREFVGFYKYLIFY